MHRKKHSAATKRKISQTLKNRYLAAKEAAPLAPPINPKSVVLRSSSEVSEFFNMTLRRIRGILDSAFQSSSMRQWADFCNHLLTTDPQLHTVLERRTRGVTGKDIFIEPLTQSDEDKVAAEVVKTIVTKIPGFRDVLQKLVTALVSGVAVCQIVWRQNENGTYLPERIEPVPTRNLLIVERNGRQEWAITLDPKKPEPVYFPESDHRTNFIVHSPFHLVEDYRSKGLLRPVAAYSYFKSVAYSFWLDGAERFAFPTLLLHAPRGTAESQLDALFEVARNIRQDKGGVLMDGATVTTVEAASAAGGSSIWKDIIQTTDATIAKMFLGGTLTLESSATGMSRALGQVHEDAFYDLMISDAEALSETIREYLLRPIIELNISAFDKVPNIPTFWINLGTFRPIDSMLLSTGKIRVNQILREYGLPPLPKEEGGEDFYVPPQPGLASAPVANEQMSLEPSIPRPRIEHSIGGEWAVLDASGDLIDAFATKAEAIALLREIIKGISEDIQTEEAQLSNVSRSDRLLAASLLAAKDEHE